MEIRDLLAEETFLRALGAAHFIQLPAMLIAQRLFSRWRLGPGEHQALLLTIRRVIRLTLLLLGSLLATVSAISIGVEGPSVLAFALMVLTVVLAILWVAHRLLRSADEAGQFRVERLMIMGLVCGMGALMLGLPRDVQMTGLGTQVLLLLSLLWVSRALIEHFSYRALYGAIPPGALGRMVRGWRRGSTAFFALLGTCYLLAALVMIL